MCYYMYVITFNILILCKSQNEINLDYTIKLKHSDDPKLLWGRNLIL